MKKTLTIGSSLLTGVVSAVIAQAPVWANTAQVTGVQVNQTNEGLNVALTTNNQGDRPQVFLVNQNNSLVAEITNAQLRLPGGNNFRQENPGPGISSIEVSQTNPNTVTIVVAGNGTAPNGRIMQVEGQGVTLAVDRSGGPTANLPIIPPPSVPTIAQNSPRSAPPPPPGDVLIPNPNIKIDGLPQSPGGLAPNNPAPSFLPGAVPPPLGDIAVSNLDPSPSVINLGTNQIIPRLVLRDAPVRDVLALLARNAGLNIAFTTDIGTQPGQPATQQAGQADNQGPKISLDIENESVQDVFNYVLRLSGLQANLIGRTIFVGKTLPLDSRNIVVRTLRMNQVGVDQAEFFLAAQGAEVQRIVQEIEEQAGNPQTGQPFRRIEKAPELKALSAKQETGQNGPLLLRGLSVVSDKRLNSISLIGEPRKVEMAVGFLSQLDLRRRQVAVNVKVIDINLSGENNTNSSFSFGINKSFFVNDGGAASVNFGGINPPSSEIVRSGITNPPTVPNPFYDGGVADLLPRLDLDGTQIVPLTAPNGGIFLRPVSPITNRIDRQGIDQTSFEPFSRNEDGSLNSAGSATFRLFPFFQYPKQFLSLLQAQIINRQAKILTDPTLVVQEGEKATVNLTEEVVSNIKVERQTQGLDITTTTTVEKGQAGLILGIEVERIDDNGFVSVRVNPTVNGIGRSQTINLGAAGGTNQIQLLQSRNLDSGLIRLRDNQTLIVSGIIADRERTEASKVPILGDLPILGALFRRTNKINERAEVVVLLTPQILDDGDRSNFGYQYNPSPDARQLLQRNGQTSPYR